MAYSPSPTSPLTGRRSPSPPAQPLSKREKRRNQHVGLQQELQAEFDDHREQHYRSQLIALQQDMNLVTTADPYRPEPLDDSPEEIADLVSIQASGTPYQSEMSSLAGRWYTEFVHEVNEAKEAKELALIELHRQHEAKLERLKYECDYRLHLAAKEAEHMKHTLRERLIQTLTNKRQKLMKEKEQLDIADTNALLLHPSQFSITNPTSPGGTQISRKTRLTRHRGEHDEMTNGISEVNKRKRKFGGGGEDDIGSPSRNGHNTPAERARNANISAQLDKAYSINQLFTEKELNLQSHQAQIATRHFFQASQEKEVNGRKAGDEDANEEDSEADDNDELEATGMERTASQNVHVTRSTRNIGGMGALGILGDLAEKQPRRPTLPYATLHSAQGKNGTFLPPVSRLMDEEVEEDRAKIAEAMRRGEGEVDKAAIEEALKPMTGARSNLAPDWPVYLDMHLVNIDPRRSTKT
ncbi:hypothetical protein LTR64_004450 [Lithohypha guttulata]|uniref:uncharacterized protein n=1 Tax=Lithohypha guttulata TaxID=1690604 RepID=UPI002DDFA571|nr:hypothetical protein LTR51_006255 [Lithohypha guttulata]